MMDMEYEYNLLLHIDSDDVKTLDMALENAHHFLTAFTDETIRLVLIVNGPGVKLITMQYQGQAKKASEMTARAQASWYAATPRKHIIWTIANSDRI